MLSTNQKLEDTHATLGVLSSTVGQLADSLSKTQSGLGKTMGELANSDMVDTTTEKFIVQKYFRKLKFAGDESKQLRCDQQKAVRSLIKVKDRKDLSLGFEMLRHNLVLKKRQDKQDQRDNHINFQTWVENIVSTTQKKFDLIENDRVTKTDFIRLKQSVDPNTCSEIFKCTQEYVNARIDELQNTFEDNYRSLLRQMNSTASGIENRVHKDELKDIVSKLKNTSSYITQATIANSMKVETAKSIDSMSAFTHYFDQMQKS